MEVRGEERKAVFWLVHEALSAQLLREKLEYDAKRVAEEQERERERGPKVYCQIPGDMCLILDVYSDTQEPYSWPGMKYIQDKVRMDYSIM